MLIFGYFPLSHTKKTVKHITCKNFNKQYFVLSLKYIMTRNVVCVWSEDIKTMEGVRMYFSDVPSALFPRSLMLQVNILCVWEYRDL